MCRRIFILCWESREFSNQKLIPVFTTKYSSYICIAAWKWDLLTKHFCYTRTTDARLFHYEAVPHSIGNDFFSLEFCEHSVWPAVRWLTSNLSCRNDECFFSLNKKMCSKLVSKVWNVWNYNQNIFDFSFHTRTNSIIVTKWKS